MPSRQASLDEWPDAEGSPATILDPCRVCLILALVILGAREIIPLV